MAFLASKAYCSDAVASAVEPSQVAPSVNGAHTGARSMDLDDPTLVSSSQSAVADEADCSTPPSGSGNSQPGQQCAVRDHAMYGSGRIDKRHGSHPASTFSTVAPAAGFASKSSHVVASSGTPASVGSQRLPQVPALGNTEQPERDDGPRARPSVETSSDFFANSASPAAGVGSSSKTPRLTPPPGHGSQQQLRYCALRSNDKPRHEGADRGTACASSAIPSRFKNSPSADSLVTNQHRALLCIHCKAVIIREGVPYTKLDNGAGVDVSAMMCDIASSLRRKAAPMGRQSDAIPYCSVYDVASSEIREQCLVMQPAYDCQGSMLIGLFAD